MPAVPPVLGTPGAPRSPKKVAWLSAVTLGVYALVWFYRFGQEIDEAGRFGIQPKRYYKQIAIVAALIVTLPVALVHFFVYAFRVSKAVDELSSRVGLTDVELQDRFALLPIPFVGVAYVAALQRAANRVWAKMARPAGAAPKPTAG